MAGKRGQRSTKGTTPPARFLPNFVTVMDGRTRAAKAITDRMNELMVDLGGKESLSYQQRSLVERAIHLEAVLQSWEEQLRDGKEVNVGNYTQLLNSMLGLFRHLGITRREKKVNISDYVESSYGT